VYPPGDEKPHPGAGRIAERTRLAPNLFGFLGVQKGRRGGEVYDVVVGEGVGGIWYAMVK